MSAVTTPTTTPTTTTSQGEKRMGDSTGVSGLQTHKSFLGPNPSFLITEVGDVCPCVGGGGPGGVGGGGGG